VNKSREIAFAAARQAGELLANRLGDVRQIDYKGVANIVTDVDKASEAIILKIIRSEFPDDEILAEESGKTAGKKTSRRWVVDPLDGTTNYAHAYPCFCVSIGLLENGKRILGVVFDPILNELFWAELGEGAWLNDKPIHVSHIDKLEASLLATGFRRNPPEDFNTTMEQFRRLTSLTHGVRRDGSAALDLCYVACGRFEGFWERRLAAWDVGAGSLIVEEAGGTVSDLTNGELDVDRGNVIASNGLIHKELVLHLDEEGVRKSLAVSKG
jgi:myo-inositol-1(or 4)-monophosphatase